MFKSQQLNKLATALEAAGIEYKDASGYGFDPEWIERIHWEDPRTHAHRSVICGPGSYGYEGGFLEAQPPVHGGCDPDDVEGWLDADTIIGYWVMPFTYDDKFIAVNLTPHPINIFTPGGEEIEIDPAAPAPRVSTEEAVMWRTSKGVPIKRIDYGEIDGLPAPQPGVALVVSQLCCQADPYRRDLFFPADLKRDEKGRITGCAALGQVPRP